MKVSLNWLSDYVKVSLPAEELAGQFLRIGFPVEGITSTDTDIVLDLEVTSNRPDLLGHLGVARELVAATGAPFDPPKINALPTTGRAADMTSVQVLDPDLCPRYTARVIRNVKVGPSPSWLVERLEAVGLRSINNVVDVTNYVLMEYSQPLHAFDYDKLEGRRIIVRRAAEGETLVSIDRTRCALEPAMLVIADARRPVAIAGIMGGLDTEVGEGTTTVLLESAQFDPLVTRRTSRKLGILSESNYRFERGVDPVGLDEASLRACQLILQTAGGQLAEGIVDVWAKPFQPPVVALRPQRTHALLGMDVPAERQLDILRRLHLSPRTEGGKIVCTIPPWRADLTREVDLIEEVARLEGYDKVPVGGRITHAVTAEPTPQRLRRQAAETMAAAGFDETVTLSFVDDAEAALFGCADPVHVDPLVRKTTNALRPSLLPSLLRVCKTNQDAGAVEGVDLFEIAAVFVPAGSSALPKEHTELALAGTSPPRRLRGALEALAARIAPHARLEVRPGPVAGLAPESSAEILLDGQPAGVIGSVSPEALAALGLEKPQAAAAIDLDALIARGGAVARFRPLPKFPSVWRDLSFLVEEAVTWSALLSAIEAVPQPLRAGVEYVTIYRGKPIPAGRKSVTVRLTYRSDEGTLRGEDVDAQVEQVVKALGTSLSAELRA